MPGWSWAWASSVKVVWWAEGLVILGEVLGGTDGFARSYNVIPAWHLHAEILGIAVVR